MMNARNPKYNAVGTIDLEYEHPDFGWIPFTASPDDIEELGQTLHAQALAGDFGQVEAYVIPASEILRQKKAERQAIVDAITVTVTSGKVFDGNEEAQARMSRAIQTSQIASIPSTTWVLANNVPTEVTLTELQEALALSMQAMGAVWATPYF